MPLHAASVDQDIIWDKITVLKNLWKEICDKTGRDRRDQGVAFWTWWLYGHCVLSYHLTVTKDNNCPSPHLPGLPSHPSTTPRPTPHTTHIPSSNPSPLLSLPLPAFRPLHLQRWQKTILAHSLLTPLPSPSGPPTASHPPHTLHTFLPPSLSLTGKLQRLSN